MAEKPTLVKIDNWPTSVASVIAWLVYFGGNYWTAEQPGFGFWDGLIWPWYVGRYIAAHFTMLSGG